MSVENLTDERLYARLCVVQSMLVNVNAKDRPMLDNLLQRLLAEQVRRDGMQANNFRWSIQ